MPHMNNPTGVNKDEHKQFNIKILADGKILLSMMGKDGFDDYAYDTLDEAFADIKSDVDLSGNNEGKNEGKNEGNNEGKNNKKEGKAMMDKLMKEGDDDENQ